MAYLMFPAQGNSAIPSQPVRQAETMPRAPAAEFGKGFGGDFAALFAGRRVAHAFSARVAIRRACDLMGLGPGTEVLAPAYNCGSELDPVLDAGAAVRLYPISETLATDVAAVERMIGPQTRAIYLIHYFGVINPATRDLRALCDRHGLRLIEDCALSLLSGEHPAEGRAGDVAVFCFYKFFPFPVIRGGALVVNAPDLPDPGPFPRPAPEARVAAQALRQALLRLPLARAARRRLRPARAPRAVPAEAEQMPDMPAAYYFDHDLRDRAISRLTLAALARVDPGRAIRARRANYLALAALLRDRPGLRLLVPDLPDDAVPLGLPLAVAGRDRIARALTAQGFATPTWWAGGNRRLGWTGSETAAARRLKEEVLLLPVDQGWRVEDMAALAAALERLLPGA